MTKHSTNHQRMHLIMIGAGLIVTTAAMVCFLSARAIAEPAKLATHSAIRGLAVRLTPGQDLKKELLAFARREGLQAPAIVTCVGSLTEVTVRLANQKEGQRARAFLRLSPWWDY